MKTIDQQISAAVTISIHGVKGLMEASKKVGYEVALGMLIAHLMAKNPTGGWKHRRSCGEEVQKILMREGALNFCYYSPSTGRGLVYENGIQFALLRVENDGVLESLDGLHIPMMMQGPDDYTIIPAGPHPFSLAYGEMKSSHDKAFEEIKRRHKAEFPDSKVL